MNTPTIGRLERRGFLGRRRAPSALSTLAGSGALLLAATLGACAAPADDAAETPVAEAAPQVRLGIEVLLTDSLHLVKGKKVGLITNHSGMDRNGKTTIDLLHEHPDIELVALFGPEHGIRGDALAGVEVDNSVDAKTGVPVYSLFGSTFEFKPEMLENVDALVYDIMDVNVRYYTYPSTMAYGIKAAGEKGIPFIVLDRPNPIRGDVVQGNILDPAFSSFVGLYPVPMRHGLTMGELARMISGEFGAPADVRVVPAEGWRRNMTFDQTGLPWVKPSPNLPTLAAALAYSGTCLFEGTPLSVGRGTDFAYEWIGAPWLDGAELAAALNAYAIPGVTFEPATFTPGTAADKKFEGVEVYGVRFVPTSTDYDAPRAGIAALVEIYKRSTDHWKWSEGQFDRLAGTDQIRLAVEAGKSMQEITAGWDEAVAAFRQRSAPYLIYR
ncbi:MAG: exo-beta-N-acetylmuramidase NamZ family protein [Longimicrobiales bacterium]